MTWSRIPLWTVLCVWHRGILLPGGMDSDVGSQDGQEAAAPYVRDTTFSNSTSA